MTGKERREDARNGGDYRSQLAGRKTYYSAPGHHGKFASPFWATASLSDLGQVTSLPWVSFSCSEVSGPAGSVSAASPRGLQAPPPSASSYRGNPGHSRESVSPRRPPKGHAARRSLGLLPGRALSPWLPRRPPPRRAKPS